MPNWNFNTQQTPGEGQNVAGGAFASFLQNFASVYNKMKESELENHFKMALMKKTASTDSGIKEYQSYAEKGFRPLQSEDMVTDTAKLEAGQMKGAEAGYSPVYPGEKDVRTPTTLPDNAVEVSPALKSVYPEVVGMREPAAKPKEWAPESSESLTRQINTVDDDIRKQRSMSWSLFPFLSKADQEVGILRDPTKIGNLLSEKSDWYSKKMKTLDVAIQNGELPESERDNMKQYLKDIVQMHTQAAYLKKKLGSRIDAEMGSENKPVAEPVKKVDMKDFSADVLGAKEAIAGGKDRATIIKMMTDQYGNREWDKILSK